MDPAMPPWTPQAMSRPRCGPETLAVDSVFSSPSCRQACDNTPRCAQPIPACGEPPGNRKGSSSLYARHCGDRSRKGFRTVGNCADSLGPAGAVGSLVRFEERHSIPAQGRWPRLGGTSWI